MKSNFCLRMSVLIVIILACACIALPQEFRATLSGHISDPTGASVSGATVTVKNLQTGEQATATTGETAGATATTGGSTEAGTGPKLNKDVSGDIEMWHFWSSPVRRNAIRRVINICKAELPNINVTEVAKPFGDIWTANTAAVAAGSGMPDVIVADRPKLPQDAANNIYTDLQEMATRDGITGEEFWPFTWEQTLYQGDTYGLPYETDVRVMFYNKNAFKDAGLEASRACPLGGPERRRALRRAEPAGRRAPAIRSARARRVARRGDRF